MPWRIGCRCHGLLVVDAMGGSQVVDAVAQFVARHSDEVVVPTVGIFVSDRGGALQGHCVIL